MGAQGKGRMSSKSGSSGFSGVIGSMLMVGEAEIVDKGNFPPRCRVGC